jgi:outer membrane protein insertion porin family
LANAKTESFFIDEVRVNCDLAETCDLLKKKFMTLQGKEFDPSGLIFELKSRLFDQIINSFEYKIEKEEEKNILDINITTRKIIDSIRIFSTIKSFSVDSLIPLLPIQEGDFYNSELISQIPSMVSKYLLDLGVVESEVEVKLIPSETEINIEINISNAKISRITKIRWYYKENRNIDIIKRKILKLGGKVYNRKEINLMIDQISRQIFEEGYPFSYIKLRPISPNINNKSLTLEFDIRLGERTIFDFSGYSLISRNTLLTQIKEKLRDQGFLDQEQFKKIIISEINESYQEIGIFNTKINVDVIHGIASPSEKMKTYFIKIVEGKKIKIEDIFFTGNRFFNDEYLKKIYFTNGTSLSNNKYLDNQFLEKYKQMILEEYLKEGFVNVEVSEPKISIGANGDKAIISMSIKEYKQAILTGIKFPPKVQKLFDKEIKEVISNQVGDPLDVLILDSDIEEIEKFLKNQGYPFAKIKNKDNENIIIYNQNYTGANLYLEVELGKKSYFNTFYVSGNKRTKEEVFQRESTFKNGELLTWEKINHFIERISNTGLFKEVKVLPRPVEGISLGDDSQLVDLVVEVVERDFASLELGPGFRTDLGLRLTAKFKLINLAGMARRLSFRGELNQRLIEESALSPGRRGLYPLAFLEYFADVKYEEPYLGNTPIGMDVMTSIGRRRYRTFDSDIFLSGITLSEATSWFAPLLRYQYENDFQYNAQYEKDQGTFRIGSLAPSLSFDFRDRRVNPTRGLFLSLLGEYASPKLGSIDANNYKINFFSIISRNNFYVPFSYDWVGAMYLSAGYQKNLETGILADSSGNPVLDDEGIPTTVGYIPTVKVFRLEGSDNVRGYRNSEINTLSNGLDIAQVVVNDTAYYLNIKIEGRHYLKDNIVIYPFFDAGSIQVNHWVPFDLKTSVGIGIRYLTPMGSLELDFGVKTHRNAGESFGSVDLMIGYF